MIVELSNLGLPGGTARGCRHLWFQHQEDRENKKGQTYKQRQG